VAGFTGGWFAREAYNQYLFQFNRKVMVEILKATSPTTQTPSYEHGFSR